jgi:mono/diheme cytochrome c family protein
VTKLLLILILPLFAWACDSGSELAAPTPMPGKPDRNVVRGEVSPARLTAGRTLFQTYCAACHGAQAQGDPEWRRKNPDGTWRPPALNGTAHAWHHPAWELREQIRTGSAPGVGNMPPFAGVLTDEEIDSIILWFQSLWPDEVYVAWWEIDQRRGPSSAR